MARRLLDTVLTIVFTVPGKEVGQEASKDGQKAVGHSEDGQGAC
jgi:hypothetical protein